jgi:hypothetical protein
VAELKALAYELPATYGLPLSRFSRTELHRLVVERGLSEASASTIWRWLHDDALKPWQRSWIFVCDPDFAWKACRVLDLYQRRFEGRRLRPDEYVRLTPVLPRTLLRLAMGVGSAESEASRRIASEGRVLDPPVRYPRRRTKRQIELPWPSSARKAIAEPPAPVSGTFSHPSLRS